MAEALHGAVFAVGPVQNGKEDVKGVSLAAVQFLEGGAKDLGTPGVDPVFGWGLLDVTKAAMGPSNFAWGDFSVAIMRLAAPERVEKGAASVEQLLQIDVEFGGLRFEQAFDLGIAVFVVIALGAAGERLVEDLVRIVDRIAGRRDRQ